MKVRTCPKCREVNSGRSPYCAACGASLADVPASSMVPGAEPPGTTQVLRDRVIFCGKVIAIGLALMLVGVIAQLIDRGPYERLVREGRQMTGTVIECSTRAKKTYSSHFISQYTTIYELSYRFDAPVNGVLTTFKGWAEVEPEDCLFSRDTGQLLELLAARQYDQVMGAGQPIEVIYVASDPSAFALKDKLKPPPPTFVLTGCILGCPFLVIGIAALVDTFKARQDA